MSIAQHFWCGLILKRRQLQFLKVTSSRCFSRFFAIFSTLGTPIFYAPNNEGVTKTLLREQLEAYVFFVSGFCSITFVFLLAYFSVRITDAGFDEGSEDPCVEFSDDEEERIYIESCFGRGSAGSGHNGTF